MANLRTVKTTTTAPTGLSISRSGLNITVSWKVGDASYSAQTVNYRCLNTAGAELKSWTNVPVSQGDTSVTFGLSASFTNLGKIEVRVRGIRGQYEDPNWRGVAPGVVFPALVIPDWSSWSTIQMPIYPAAMPTISDGWESSSASQSKFSYSVQDESAPKRERPVARIEYQTALLTNFNSTARYANWQSVASQSIETLSGTVSRSESGLSGSKTRVIRMRAVGVGGASEWAYAQHVYSTPYAPVLKSAKATKGNGATTTLTVVWGQQIDDAHPVDHCQVEYAITTPGAEMSVPSGVSFSALEEVLARRGYDNTYSYTIPAALGANEVLFVRVKTTSGTRTSYSAAKIALVGELTAPSGVAIETFTATHTATITATNNSTVPDSFLTVEWREKGKKSFIAGIIPHGQTKVTITVPAWTNQIAVAVQAVVGSYKYSTQSGVNYYSVTKQMVSKLTEEGGNVPLVPAGVGVVPHSNWSGAAVVTWTWNWQGADAAEVSWSNNPDAWESVKPPSAYEVQNVYAGRWTVPDLSMGVRWYFRVRFLEHNGDVVTYGPYSTPVSLVLYSAPAIPSLTLSTGVASPSDTVTASWAYVSTDGTQQAYAELNTVPARANPIARVSNGQSVSFKPKSFGWAPGSTQQIRVRVVSGSNMTSEWSDPVPLMIAPELSITLSGVSLTNGKLTALPLRMTVTGAGTAGTTMVAIERITDYKMMRPDGHPTYGYNGETVALVRHTGEGQVTITADDLLPGTHLDDGAMYAIVATVKDVYGRKISTSQNFEVEWSHKAQTAAAEVELQGDIAVITPTAQAGGAEGDYADIYRMTVDGPELLYHGAEFGVAYVDPYPTIGDFGGYRVVYCTANGDYISDSGTMMWTDYRTFYKTINNIIDTANDRLELKYNVEQTDSWDKEFTETKYLGGHVVGDWLAGVSRKSGLNADVIRDRDPYTVLALRKLAQHAGPCHVRTVDGSNYWADVQVSRSNPSHAPGRTAGVTLTITRVDQDQPDGVPLSEWEERGA